MTDNTSTNPTFLRKKTKLVQRLSISAEEYDDRSPKGSVDEGIRSLIDEILQQDGLVTTSSCAGRISVFLDGQRSTQKPTREDADQTENEHQVQDTNSITSGSQTKDAGVEGKGGGGRWLYITHDPVEVPSATLPDATQYTELFGLSNTPIDPSPPPMRDRRYVHFKFEPMILHVLTTSPQRAQNVLTAALQAGFRESGAINLCSRTEEGAMPLVAVRSTGLALDSIIGYLQEHNGMDPQTSMQSMVSEGYLQTLVALGNERFIENAKRTEHFRKNLLRLCDPSTARDGGNERLSSSAWEEGATRRERKRAEGLQKQQELRARATTRDNLSQDEASDELNDVDLCTVYP